MTDGDPMGPEIGEGEYLPTLVLGEADVRRLLDLRECVDVQAAAMRAHAAGLLVAPLRHSFDVPAGSARFAVMPGFLPDDGLLACKLLTSAPGNRARGLGRGLSTLLLGDARTGYPLAFMASTFLTAARTAATAVLALRTLAPAERHDVGLYGTGPIAQLVVRTLAAIGGPWSVLAYSPTSTRREGFVDRCEGALGVDVATTDDPRGPASCAIVVAATDGTGAAFSASWLREGATVVSVASRAAVAEVPPEAFAGAWAVVDDARAARAEAAEFKAGVAIHAELGSVLSGVRPGRGSERERWICKTTGMGLQDAMTARAVYARALRDGVGVAVPIVTPTP